MALTLKTTGPAAKAVSVIAVDDDGATVKDFVTGRTITYNAAIAAPRIGAATWKGVSRSHFKTDYSPDQFSPRGAVYGATLPPVPMGAAGNGISWFCACNQLVDAAAGNIFWLTGDNNQGARIATGSKLEVLCGNTSQGLGTTTLPAATKMSFGFNQKYSTNALPFFFGLESGSLATDGTYNEGGFGSTTVLSMFGGHAGYGSASGEYFVHAVFSDAVLLTEAEMQSLHNDWFGTLFEATTTPFSGTGIATVLSARAVVASGAFGLVYRITGTMVDPSTGAPRANLTGIDAAFFDESNPSGLTTPRQTITNLTTDGSGNFTWSLPNSTLVAGQTGLFVARHAALGYLGAYRVTLVA